MENTKFIDDKHLSFCRYIKNEETIGEFKIPDGSSHRDRLDVAKKNNLDFDYYFIFYVEENNGNRHYDYFINKKGAAGMNKKGDIMYLFDSEDNKIIEKCEDVFLPE